MSFCPSVRYDVGIMSFCFSVRADVGFYLPSLGERLGVGIMSFCPSVRYAVTPHMKILYRGLKIHRNPATI